MGPRKSDTSKVPSGDDGTPAKCEREGVNVEDLSLPRTIVSRLAKGVLPPNTQIQKDAVLAISKSATVFVSYLCSNANENALRANKKTIVPKDVLEAVTDMELAGFLPRLEAELAKYNEIQTAKRSASKKKVADKANGSDSAAANGNGVASREAQDEDSPRAAKRARRGSAAAERADSVSSPSDQLRGPVEGASGDDTVSEADGEGPEGGPGEDDDGSEGDEIEDSASGEEPREEEEREDELNERVQRPPDDEAFDNGEDSD